MSRGEGGGRPRFVIDFEMVERLAKIQCTMEEIAAFLGCSLSKLEKSATFLRVYKKGKEGGKMSLRRRQWKALEEGNQTMLIWLGKQYLGQREKKDIEATVFNPEPLSSFYNDEEKED